MVYIVLKVALLLFQNYTRSYPLLNDTLQRATDKYQIT